MSTPGLGLVDAKVDTAAEDLLPRLQALRDTMYRMGLSHHAPCVEFQIADDGMFALRLHLAGSANPVVVRAARFSSLYRHAEEAFSLAVRLRDLASGAA